MHLYMRVSVRCVAWTWGNHYRSTPSLPKKVKSLLKSGEVLKKTRALALSHILLCIWSDHSERVTHRFTLAHASKRGVSFGDVCTQCTGCQPLHWAKCSAAKIALIVWAGCIQIQKYKNMAIVDAFKYYLVLGNIPWS